MGKRLTKQEVQIKLDENFGHNMVELLSDVTNKRNPITIKCNQCQYIWTTKAQNVLYMSKEIKKKYCPNCLKQDRENKWVNTKCSYCGKEIKRLKSSLKENNFCSKNVVINLKTRSEKSLL